MEPPTRPPIRIPKVAEMVANALRRQIVTGEYEVGEVLPNEGELMASFDVARTTIRDAFRVLETEGLLEVRRGGGGGGRVRAPGTAMVADYAALLLQFEGATLEDVHTARMLIEAPAAGLLARARDPETIATLQAILDKEAAAVEEDDLIRAEGRFHRAVVELTGNRALSLLSAVANNIVAGQIARRVDGMRTRSGVIGTTGLADAHRAHVRLVKLVASGDDVEAEKLWRRHLEAATEELARHPRAARTVIDLLP